ncbi:MAG: hypothetical protein BWY88_00440 [Synergistetes bacterium ADurb.Bin520]|nr:MAG: hypothetical protein BWY88_00440 [Synergistetes bacterium ADurb.Bin520]
MPHVTIPFFHDATEELRREALRRGPLFRGGHQGKARHVKGGGKLHLLHVSRRGKHGKRGPRDLRHPTQHLLELYAHLEAADETLFFHHRKDPPEVKAELPQLGPRKGLLLAQHRHEPRAKEKAVSELLAVHAKKARHVGEVELHLSYAMTPVRRLPQGVHQGEKPLPVPGGEGPAHLGESHDAVRQGQSPVGSVLPDRLKERPIHFRHPEHLCLDAILLGQVRHPTQDGRQRQQENQHAPRHLDLQGKPLFCHHDTLLKLSP